MKLHTRLNSESRSPDPLVRRFDRAQRRVMPIPGFRVLHKCGHYENHEGINKAQADRLAKRVCELCAEDLFAPTTGSATGWHERQPKGDVR